MTEQMVFTKQLYTTKEHFQKCSFVLYISYFVRC